MPLRIAVLGAAGRMGKSLIREISVNQDLFLAAGLASADSSVLGEDAGSVAGLPANGVTITSDIEAAADSSDVIIDFSKPNVSVYAAKCAAHSGCALVIGTTGFDSKQQDEIVECSKSIVIVKSGSMSVGVSILEGVLEKVSAILGDEFDAEVVDFHHKNKMDSPSGTALQLGQAIAFGRGAKLADVAAYNRVGVHQVRRSGDIGFAVLRGGSVVSEHSVVFAGAKERVEFTHKAEGRSVYSKGAIKAAIWAQLQRPGLYTMGDVLGINRILAGASPK